MQVERRAFTKAALGTGFAAAQIMRQTMAGSAPWLGSRPAA